MSDTAQTAVNTAESSHSLDGTIAFDATRPTLEVQPPAPVITTDVGFMVQTALSMPKRLEPILAELTAAVPNYDFKRNLVLLTTSALSLNFLQAKYRLLRRSTNTVLVDWLTKRRSRMQAFGEVLVSHDLVAEADLAALRHTNNHHALGYDVMGLSEMLVTHFDYVACQLLKREDLIEARTKANELFVELGTRDFGPNAAEEVKLLRRKNYALTLQQFNELVDAIRYGRSRQKDADQYIPTLFPKGPRRKEDEDTDDDEGSSSDASPAQNGAANAGTAANTASAADKADVAAINRIVAQSAAAASNGLGLPTSAPFRLTEDS